MRYFKQIIVALTFLPFCNNLYAQTGEEKGLRFQGGQSWEQILNKAKQENKYIFVDCYATWCGPCKQMDAAVYPDAQVGSYMDDKFICVKVQMDRTKQDNEVTKQWYETAKTFETYYKVDAYPTFLYFSPGGQIVHKHTGSGNAADFLNWAKDAQDPQKQYYAILRNFKPGGLDTADERSLANANHYTDRVLAGKLLIDYLDRDGWEAIENRRDFNFLGQFNDNQLLSKWLEGRLQNVTPLQLRQQFYSGLFIYFSKDTVINTQAGTLTAQLPKDHLADSVYSAFLVTFEKNVRVQEVVGNYLSTLSDTEMMKKENLLLASYFSLMIQPNDRWFDLFWKNAKQIDKIITQQGFSDGVVDDVVSKHLVDPVIKKVPDNLASEPDWQTLAQRITRTTDTAIAARTINGAKSVFYQSKLRKAEAIRSPERFIIGAKLSTVLLASVTDQQVANVQGILGMAFLNNAAWIIFQYSNDPRELKGALKWSKKAMDLGQAKIGDDLDTYANLLYKLGYKKEALKWEEKAVIASPKETGLADDLEKIKKGLATWPQPDKNN